MSALFLFFGLPLLGWIIAALLDAKDRRGGRLD